MSVFLEKFQKTKEEKNSIMCIGLDPAVPRMRDKDIMPEEKVKNKDETKAKVDFCSEIIENVSDFSCAIKPNTQYTLDFGKKEHKKITKLVHDAGMIVILDHKLSDIGSTNQAALFNIKEFGYDALTISPFPGNIKEMVDFSKQYQLGTIFLTLMSNPEAVSFMKEAKINGKPGYMFIAEKVREFDGDGVVVGATGHVTTEEIKQIRKIIGGEKLIFVPGVGRQGGDVEKVLSAAGENVLIHVGRDIMYSDNQTESARKYNELFNSLRIKND